MKDLVIICSQCQSPFVFTVSEQIRHKERNFDFPKRCQECRRKKSASKSYSNVYDKREGKLDRQKSKRVDKW